MDDRDELLKCFCPLFNSMRVFGLYFTRGTHRVDDTSAVVTSQSENTRNWNAGRIYALVFLIVSWLNAARMLSMFDKSDKFGVVLLLKLPMAASGLKRLAHAQRRTVSSGLSGALFPTACFVACQTGNLDRIFRDATPSKSDIARYRRLAVVHTIACWVLLVVELLLFLVPTFRADDELSSAMAPFGVHVSMSNQYLRIVAEVMIIPMFVHGAFSWLICYSVNYISGYTLRSYTVLTPASEN